MSDDGDRGGEILRFPGQAEPPPAGLVGAVEALLFAAGEVVETKELAAVLSVEADDVRAAISALQDRHRGEGSGLRVVRVAGGWQMRTSPELAGLVLALRREKPAKLSRAALEVLAVIAYEQPVTRHQIDALRGVDSGGVLKSLLDKGIVKTAGRRDEPGRPLEYRTTATFLEMFSLPGLEALPTLAERTELERDRDPRSPPEEES